MRDYGRIHTRFWEQPEITALSVEARLLAVYLLSSPHSNLLGCYRLPKGYVADDLRLDEAALERAFADLEGLGLVHRCAVTGWLLLPNHLKYNPIDNGNQAKAALKLIAKVPPTATLLAALRAAIRAHAGRYADTLLGAARLATETADGTGPDKGSAKGSAKGSPDPRANQEQEQQQDQQQEPERSRAARPNARGARLTLTRLPPAWRAFAEQTRPDLDPEHTWAQFRDYWVAKPGREGVKADWLATWRNWVRREAPPATARRGGSGTALAARNRAAVATWLGAAEPDGAVIDGACHHEG
ncbi:hypothetical protein [Marichromatium gracile]|uniref:Helix-turn-helix protein n=1 Tax=Marichromatium gracile TaxID=1048 RepID=A0ABR5VE79_MARGR|nr:hypothetical protein [Marichromatium gracile]KXX64035.1 hypothetical protein AY586_15005 [Marichromatium gracile]